MPTGQSSQGNGPRRLAAGQGIAISSATRGLLHNSTLTDRAPIFSAIYLLCYSGAAFPSLVSGQLSNAISLPRITLGYAVLAIVATLFTVLAARGPRTGMREHPAQRVITTNLAGTRPRPTVAKGFARLAELTDRVPQQKV
ncbi:hypothetical protein ACFYXS_05775 [Streptomyces sp. NPDC002574]|uniref:hypothetical protein n=1 Tax=Streptomyces sp. NPDC002574 TaxID=3364652 RepID=UPI003675A6AD